MAVAMLIDNPAGTQEIYDQVRAQLDLAERPAGGILHIAGPAPDGGWRVIEVWETQEDAKRFVEERLLPALESVGVSGPRPEMQFWPVHNIMA